MTNAARNHRAGKACGEEGLFVARLHLTRHAAPHASIATPVGHLMPIILRRMDIDTAHGRLAFAGTFNRAPTALNHIRQRHAIRHAIVVDGRHGNKFPLVKNLKRVFNAYLAIGILHGIVFHKEAPLNHGEHEQSSTRGFAAEHASPAARIAQANTPTKARRMKASRQSPRAHRMHASFEAQRMPAISLLDYLRILYLPMVMAPCRAAPFLIQCATNRRTSRRRVGNRALGSIATLGL